jgi:sensor histidine kinase regulating citrate/malate metabolism
MMPMMRAALSLRLRLALLVAIVVAAVIAIEGFLEIRMFQRSVQDDYLQAAAATARAVADELELRSDVDPTSRFTRFCTIFSAPRRPCATSRW